MKTFNIAQYIDHTLLKPEANELQIKKLCQEAIDYGFFSVCINPCFVPLASFLLKKTSVKICSVIGFPLGANTLEVKKFEAIDAIKNGADELDMVINVGALKNREYDLIEKEISEIVKLSHTESVLVKVIFEICLLNDEEIAIACKLCAKAGADFVKTSTGFSNGGATLHCVELMKNNINQNMQVKASGGIKDLSSALEYIKLGATRLGTSSGIAIVNGNQDKSDNY